MSFSFLDILLIIILSQGLFLLLAIQLLPNKNKEANRTLTFMLIIASIMLLGRVIIYHYQHPLILRLGTVLDGTIYLFGPFLYCYIRRLTIVETVIYKLNWKHFIPLMIYGCYFIWTLTKSRDELLLMGSSMKLYRIFMVIEFSGIVSLIYYITKSYLILKVFKFNENFQLSYNQYVYKYVFSLLIALSIFVLLWGFSFVNAYFYFRFFKYVSYDIMWISVSLLMYFIGFYTLTQPQIFRMPIKSDSIIAAKEKVKNRLKPEEIKQLEEKIKYELLESKLYLKPDLNLHYFADKVATTPNNLSWFLNQVYEKSFYEFINEYRIKDFIEKIKNKQHKHHTLFSIALEVGFNSKSTFNKSFKMVMNDTPSSYINKLKTD
jgi:AraC-like DNA-binding protein